jgi:hypothetical protein
VNEGLPAIGAEDERRSGRILRVTYCHDAGEAGGDVDAGTAVVAVAALVLVEAMSTTWGSYQAEESSGKIVWAVVG